jgi:hypothetical protein
MLRISRHRSRQEFQIAIEMRCRKSIFSLLINFNYKHPPRALPTKSKRSLSAFAILQQCCRKISMYRYIYNHIMFMGICGARCRAVLRISLPRCTLPWYRSRVCIAKLRPACAWLPAGAKMERNAGLRTSRYPSSRPK